MTLTADNEAPIAVGESFLMDNHIQREITSNTVATAVPDFEEEKPADTDPVYVKSQFQIPKSSEKREKKNKKAEEKRKAKSAKLSSEEGHGQYIPGMPGSVPPPTKELPQSDRTESPTKEFHDTKSSRHDVAVPSTHNDVVNKREERLAKPAPWANKSPIVERETAGLSLQDIQKLEAEKERKEKEAREAAEAEQREERRRREEEERLKRSMKAGNWSAVLTPSSSQVKSLAEIQAEEAKSERERFDKETKERVKRAKDVAGGAKAGNWNGKTTTITSWAGKIAAASPAPQTKNRQSPVTKERVNVVAPDGFWEPAASVAKPAKKSANPTNPPAQSAQQTNNKKKKKGGTENGATDITKQFD